MQAMAGGVWGGRVEVGEGEAVVLHSQTSIAHYSASQLQSVSHDLDYSSSCSVLRGFAEIDQVEQGKAAIVSHCCQWSSLSLQGSSPGSTILCLLSMALESTMTSASAASLTVVCMCSLSHTLSYSGTVTL